MSMGGVAKGNLGKRLAAFRGGLEGQVKRQIWPFGEVIGIRQKVIDNIGQRRIGRAEAGGEKVLERVGDLGGDGGGNHCGSIVGLWLRAMTRRTTGLPLTGGRCHELGCETGQRNRSRCVPTAVRLRLRTGGHVDTGGHDPCGSVHACIRSNCRIQAP